MCTVCSFIIHQLLCTFIAFMHVYEFIRMYLCICASVMCVFVNIYFCTCSFCLVIRSCKINFMFLVLFLVKIFGKKRERFFYIKSIGMLGSNPDQN